MILSLDCAPAWPGSRKAELTTSAGRESGITSGVQLPRLRCQGLEMGASECMICFTVYSLQLECFCHFLLNIDGMCTHPISPIILVAYRRPSIVVPSCIVHFVGYPFFCKLHRHYYPRRSAGIIHSFTNALNAMLETKETEINLSSRQ
jgi:hypothetical protein